MNKIKTLAVLLVSALVLFLFLAPTSVLAANPAASAIEQGACDAAGQTNCTDKQSAGSVNSTVADIINILSVAVGIIAVIMIIIGGLRYITSGGASEKVQGAKNTILYALIGLIIVALAQVIVHFVIHKVK
jgi:uncharacterized membrane protein